MCGAQKEQQSGFLQLSVGGCQTGSVTPKQAATWTRELAASPSGAFQWVVDPESDGNGQGAPQPDAQGLWKCVIG